MTSIVIVDAEAGSRAELERLLIKLDPSLRLFVFGLPEYAADWVKSARPALILVVSPDLDRASIALLRMVRARPECRDIPLLIAARCHDGGAFRLALELGGTDFLDYTVDRNPYKQGKYTPGTHIGTLWERTDGWI